MILLREHILGPERFDHAFRRFTAARAFKHPKTADFFRAMENDAGEDLSWWWRGWYVENRQMDLAATQIAYVDGDPKNGALVTVEAVDKLRQPVQHRVVFDVGTETGRRVPPQT